MKFEAGKFYRHIEGRVIYIAGEGTTFKWGPVYIIEEADLTGHALSCVKQGVEDDNQRWVEIGKDEFMEAFNSVRVVSQKAATA